MLSWIAAEGARARRWLWSRMKNATLVVVIAANIVVLFGSAAAALMGYRLLVVGGGSMAPMMDAGDLAIVKPVDVSAIGPGDVISYVPAGLPRVVTHRVVEVSIVQGRPHFWTMGDANTTMDANPVHPDAVVGRLAFHAPRLATQMLSPPWRVLFPLALVMWTLTPFLRPRPRRRRMSVPASDPARA